MKLRHPRKLSLDNAPNSGINPCVGEKPTRTVATSSAEGADMSLNKDPHSFTKITLDESEMPTQWYNIIPDLPQPPPPPLHPGTHEPVGPADLAPLFPMDLIMQEVSNDRYIDIPGEVLDVYRTWRPSPLFRARRLEKLLDTPARIYY